MSQKEKKRKDKNKEEEEKLTIRNVFVNGNQARK